MGQSDLVLKHTENRIAFLTLNRQEKRNALNPEMVAALKAQLNAVENDPEIRAVVLKGAGEAFCAGADLSHLQQLQTNSEQENLTDSQSLMELFRTLLKFPKLTIAQVHGAAIAGGAGLATVCDFCFATPESKLGYTEVKIGFIPAIVSTFLITKVGEAIARKLLLTGQIFTGQQALEMGLITEVCDENSLAERINIFVSKAIETTSPQSIALTKALLYQTKGMTYDQALEAAAQFNAQSRSTEDCLKGIEAFLSKQRITW